MWRFALKIIFLFIHVQGRNSVTDSLLGKLCLVLANIFSFLSIDALLLHLLSDDLGSWHTSNLL